MSDVSVAEPDNWRSRAVERLKRVVAVVRPFGWVIGVTGAVLCVAGWQLGWVEFTVPGCALVAAFLSSVVFVVGKSTFSVRLDLADRRVRVGERAAGRIAVRNVGRRRVLPAQVHLPVGENSTAFHVPSLGARKEFSEVFLIPTDRRSVVTVGPVRSARGDAFGLMSRRVRWTDPVDLFVHPKIISLAGTTSGILRDLEGQTTQVISDNDISFHALREYVPGDDRRNIHWKSTARLGTLMVRQFEDTRRTHTAIAVAAAVDEFADDDEYELAVSAAASIGVQNLRDEREVSFLAGDQALRCDSPRLLLDGCSGIVRAHRGESTSEMARRLAKEVPGASLAILVTGSILTSIDVRSASTFIPPGQRVIGLRCVNGAEARVQSRGMATQITIGSLQDLPRALRRVVVGT